MRFDEIELQAVPLGAAAPPIAAPIEDFDAHTPAPRIRRLLALLTDLSLFAALTLALTPLLPAGRSTMAIAGLAGFVVMTSYYYFAGAWLLWGKTAGGAIFDVRVVTDSDKPMSLRIASLRWLGVYFSLLAGGIGFLLAALPSRLSFPDRLSGSRCVAAG
jgi:uncharacterized RDD family membrane protein YckC